jgi:glycosyltransferase involved in cell wall biosynthesis
MTHVLHAISGINPMSGGTATALAALARAQVRAAGLRVSVVWTFRDAASDAAAEAELRAGGVTSVGIGPCRGPLMWHHDLAGVLRHEIGGADIVHVHGLWEQIQHRAARVSRKLRVPYVVTPHGMLDPWSLSQSPWKKKLYLALRMRANLDGAAAIHYTSRIERDLTVPLGLKAPTLVEPNGVDLSEFDQLPRRGTFREKHPQVGQRPVVLFLGRLHEKKGFDILIPAFARSAPRDAVLVVAGPDRESYGRTIAALAQRERVADRLVLVGMLRGRERIEALVDADLFVLPSYQENFGIAVVEALAAGCPVVISDQVNIYKEIVEAGVGGVVPTQVAPLAAELARWMSDIELRQRAAAAAPGFVRSNYDWNVIAAHWAEHYRRLAGPTDGL